MKRHRRGNGMGSDGSGLAESLGQPVSSPSFPVVGVGASAGGVEAFTQFLHEIPPDSGMAYVLIQHLDPVHVSHLTDALARATSLPIVEIRDGMSVEPDHAYVIPPGSDVGILKGKLVLFPRSKEAHKLHLPIDFFLKGLAVDRKNQAMGVVLSGAGSDGAEGLCAIKDEGGVTFAQDPRTARFSGMPEAASRTGIVDIILPIPELARELLRIGSHPFLHGAETAVLSGQLDDGEFLQILVLLRSTLGVDFSEYKQTSIRRRLAHRMALHRLTSLPEYVRLLREDRKEIQALFDDILIHVTSFFRDPDVFEKLKEAVFPSILSRKQSGGAIRIWVAGCATGEEAYSIIIALLEFLSRANAPELPIQLFGTDISEKAIERARAGFFPDSVAGDIGQERLARYFTRVESGGYQVNKNVRERCAFVRHDLASDPPFSKLDLVSCRNLLIYFDPELQKRVLATFHFGLNQPGFLLLGRAETIVDGSNLFAVVDKEDKLFSRTGVRSVLRLAPMRNVAPAAALPLQLTMRPPALPDVIRRTEGMLLDQYAPPGVVVNDRMEILHFRGRTGPYLEPAPGQPQHDLLKMARKGLVAELRIAIAHARKEKTTIRRPGVRLDQNGATRVCDLVVIPVSMPSESRENVFAVLFDEGRLTSEPLTVSDGVHAVPALPTQQEADRQARLEDELSATREYLQSIIDEHQRTNEELLSTNEELVSANEELQSLNEELETAKEELQSTNEELNTLNDELQSRNGELNSANGDLINILGSVEVPILIVDAARRIRRFTPKARPILNLLPTDLGRPIDDIRPALALQNLDQKITDVIDTVTVHEEELQGRDGRWYRLQIRPYTTVDKRIDGAVLSIVDIDVLKRALTAAEWGRDYATATVEAIQTPIVVLDEQHRVLLANEAFHETYDPAKSVQEGRNFFEVLNGEWDVPALREVLARIGVAQPLLQKLEVEHRRSSGERRTLSLSARGVIAPGGGHTVLLALDDITERLRGERERLLLHDAEIAKAAAEAENRAKDLFLATLSHELRTPLSSLLLQAQLLRRGPVDEEKLKRTAAAIERATRAQAQLIDDLLDISRVVTGKLKMELHVVKLAAVAHAALETVRLTAERKRLQLDVHLDESLPPVSGDPMRLQQAVLNLLTNAIKFTQEGGRVSVILDAVGTRGRICVSDTGMGIEPDFLAHIFDRFTQEDRRHTRTHGGLGLGLAIVRYMVEAHGGVIQAESAGKGKGCTFTVLLPLMTWTPAVASADELDAQELRPENLRGRRILVVEDDEGTREALNEMLGMTGAIVQSVESAARAMQVFEAFRPQLLVCDIAMPEEDGYSLIGRIRALGAERGGDVPALALTAFAAEDDRRRALAAGFQKHLAKPVDIDRLVRGLLELVPRRASLVGEEAGV